MYCFENSEDFFYGFPGNPFKPRCERYRRFSMGKAQPSRRHYTHTLNACLLYLLKPLKLSRGYRDLFFPEDLFIY